VSPGGVARNIAEAAHRVMTSNFPESSSLLVSAIGTDHFGRLLIEETAKVGMRTDGLIQSDKRTPVCNMILDSHGALIAGVADMEATATLGGKAILRHMHAQKPRLVAMDGNLSANTIKFIVRHCIDNDIDSTYYQHNGLIHYLTFCSLLVSSV